MYRKYFLKSVVLLTSLLVSTVPLSACGSFRETADTASSSVTSSSYHSSISPASESTMQKTEIKQMQLSVHDNIFQITLEENAAAQALTNMLPLTLEMSELNGNEKYHYLSASLPSAPEKVGTISAGDIMLYGDSCIVIFYQNFSTPYSYTKIGHIDDITGLSDALGSGSITVTFEITDSSTPAYTVQDLRNLNDFLLAKPIREDITGKSYDLNYDNQWNIFDLCLMKKQLLQQKESPPQE